MRSTHSKKRFFQVNFESFDWFAICKLAPLKLTNGDRLVIFRNHPENVQFVQIAHHEEIFIVLMPDTL